MFCLMIGTMILLTNPVSYFKMMQGNGESVYFWWGTELMCIRMREYKEHIKGIVPKAPHMWIHYATIQDVGLAPW